ncbi:thiolase family protein [Arcticibacterium luteifluviistationis]|uniref:Acetyl-CoA C-acyltransferase n=1 Tax=Arcticibacterium luteifluviistationis TaxID=1784714 RepID=A0A2Z4GA70_9BACT|nr:thiolase family protein [Arcticibacterium luteifluviistationis]AWV98096.1 hypothetical protein DJ013_07880 [Arcticibacterium luteifluviistationis]
MVDLFLCPIFVLVMANNVFIYDCLRVPSGKKGGLYKKVLCENLTSFLVNQLLERNQKAKSIVTELVVANSIGTMGNMARYAALGSTLYSSVLSSTVDLQCGGTYQAIKHGEALIAANRSQAIIAGGMESNSLMPTRIYNKNDPRYTENSHIGVASFSPNGNIDLKQAAENLALKYGLSKKQMHLWTLNSHKKASQFVGSDLYLKHILAYEGNTTGEQLIRKDLTFESLERLQSKNLIDRTNSADYHDGAGLVLLGGENSFSSKPLAQIVDIEIIGIKPNVAPEGCILGAESLLRKNGLSIDDIDIFEINESFACKPLAFMKYFNLDEGVINVLGGNLAFGHPFAASGALNLINLLCALKLSGKKYGLVSAGAAGGFGCAILIENID